MLDLPGRLLLCALLSALPAAAQQPAQVPITIGAVMPQSGILADLGAELRKALLLWQEEVNAAGGLGGRHVELALLDDRSESADAGKLYAKLIHEDKAELLIGPLGSAATLGAAATADRNRRVLVNATGAARATQKPNLRYVFQSAVPLASYGAGALALARAQGLKRVALFARDDPGSREMAQRCLERLDGDGHARQHRSGAPRCRSRTPPGRPLGARTAGRTVGHLAAAAARRQRDQQRAPRRARRAAAVAVVHPARA